MARKIVDLMPQLTFQRSAGSALGNVRLNVPYVKRTILDLMNGTSPDATGGSAIVIAAGPSLHRKQPVVEILNNGYSGDIVVADGALGYCLRNGLIPKYVLTLDPHSSRIIRWFGDPDLDSNPEDDYFRRQDLDPHLGFDERKHNKELTELVNTYGTKIKAIISTSVTPRVTRRCLEAGMELYWWNPIFDDVANRESITRQAYRLNRVPCMFSGGNVGSAAWVFANQVLRRDRIALVGMDLSYAPGTPLEKTQYYKEIRELFAEKARNAYIRIYNPYLKETWYTDPAYYWYRQTFLEMVRNAECKTLNCTEGGIVFGRGIKFVPLRSFLGSSNDDLRRT